MTGTTLPSPLFGLYEQRLHISSLSVTIIYGIYSVGVVGVVGALAVLARFGSGIRLRTRLAAGLALSAVSAAVFLVTTTLGLLSPPGCSRASRRSDQRHGHLGDDRARRHGPSGALRCDRRSGQLRRAGRGIRAVRHVV